MLQRLFLVAAIMAATTIGFSSLYAYASTGSFGEETQPLRERLCSGCSDHDAQLLIFGQTENVVASSDSEKSAEWFCHEGAVLLHAGNRNSENTTPMQWDLDILRKAADNFNECWRRAKNDNNALIELVAIKGYSMSRLNMAESEHFLSAMVLVMHERDAQSLFNRVHAVALRDARWSLQAFDGADDVLLTLDSSDDYADVSKGVQDAKQLAATVKQTIMDTTYQSIPRSKTELKVWISTNRLPMYSISSDWGLTSQERCPTKTTSITADGIANEKTGPGLTGIEVAVGSDGSLHSAHIAQSSGSDDKDQAALTRAYRLKYHPATQRCTPVDGSTTIWLDGM